MGNHTPSVQSILYRRCERAESHYHTTNPFCKWQHLTLGSSAKKAGVTLWTAAPKRPAQVDGLGSWNEPFLVQIQQPQKSHVSNTLGCLQLYIRWEIPKLNTE